jgi:hypothetical protein
MTSTMETPATEAAGPPSVATPDVKTTAASRTDFTNHLANQLARITSHATKVETLANGAKLYHLPGDREIEAMPGKSPYVVKKGTWPTSTKAPAATKPTTTAPATPTATTAPTVPPATTAAPATAPATGTK